MGGDITKILAVLNGNNILRSAVHQAFNDTDRYSVQTLKGIEEQYAHILGTKSHIADIEKRKKAGIEMLVGLGHIDHPYIVVDPIWSGLIPAFCKRDGYHPSIFVVGAQYQEDIDHGCMIIDIPSNPSPDRLAKTLKEAAEPIRTPTVSSALSSPSTAYLSLG